MAVSIASIVILILFFINVPVAFAATLASFIYFFISQDIPPTMVIQRMVAGAESIPMLAIPFFIALGSIMNYSGITKRLLKLSDVLAGHLRGGLAQTNIVLGALIGGPSGSGLADTAMICKILVPQMTEHGYSKSFSAAVTSVSGLLGPILPPGISLIIYGYIANVSIAKMFMAGILPGIIMTVMAMIAVDFVSRRRGYKPIRMKGPTFKEILVSSKEAFWGLMLIVIILGGLRAGIFTPTEAGAVTVIYTLLVGLAYKETKWADIKTALLEASRSSGAIMLIIMTSAVFAWVLTWQGVANDVTTFLTGVTTNPAIFLLLINLFLLLVGMFMDGNAAIIVLTPLLLPTVNALGIDPIHFGIIMILNLTIGGVTPPFGAYMFVVCNLLGIKVDEYVKEMVPFYLALLITLGLTTYIPALSLIFTNVVK